MNQQKLVFLPVIVELTQDACTRIAYEYSNNDLYSQAVVIGITDNGEEKELFTIRSKFFGRVTYTARQMSPTHFQTLSLEVNHFEPVENGVEITEECERSLTKKHPNPLLFTKVRVQFELGEFSIYEKHPFTCLHSEITEGKLPTLRLLMHYDQIKSAWLLTANLC